jgi:MFS family permease
MIFSVFGATAPNGYMVGAIFSAIFAQLLWWPWAYWVMAIACIVLAVAGALIIPDAPRPTFEDKSISMISRIDLPGALTGVTGLVLINFAWNQAPIVGWQTPYVYILLTVGFLFMGAFAIIESRARFPLMEFRGASPLKATALMAPLPISGVCAALTTGYILRHVPVSLVMVISMAAFAVGITLVGTMPVEQSYWIQTFLSFIFMPWGMYVSPICSAISF